MINSKESNCTELCITIIDSCMNTIKSQKVDILSKSAVRNQHFFEEEMEKRRSEKRMKLYEAQDEVDAKKETLLTNVERMLAQKVEQKELFTIRWILK